MRTHIHNTNVTIEELKVAVADTEDITINEENILFQDDTSFAVKEDNGGFGIYLIPSEEEIVKASQIMNKQRSVFTVIRTIFGIVSAVYRAGKVTCNIIENTSGEDICARLGKEVLQGMAANKRYKTTLSLMKNMSCVPLYSAQCSLYPNLYWKTTVVPA